MIVNYYQYLYMKDFIPRTIINGTGSEIHLINIELYKILKMNMRWRLFPYIANIERSPFINMFMYEFLKSNLQ